MHGVVTEHRDPRETQGHVTRVAHVDAGLIALIQAARHLAVSPRTVRSWIMDSYVAPARFGGAVERAFAGTSTSRSFDSCCIRRVCSRNTRRRSDWMTEVWCGWAGYQQRAELLHRYARLPLRRIDGAVIPGKVAIQKTVLFDATRPSSHGT
jgi:hypothetical protein